LLINIISKSFESLGTSRFRYMWFADFSLSCAEFMEMIILSWYILDKTQSPLILGIYAALRFTGTLFSPLFGVIVDRLGRRNIYLLSRLSFVSISMIVLILLHFDRLSITYILIISPFVGLTRSLDMIVRQSVVPIIVGMPKLNNALALLRTGQDITKIIGPILGGILLNTIGTSLSYIFVVLFYVFAFISVLFITGIPNIGTKSEKSFMLNFTDGLFYVRSNKFILFLLFIAFLVNLTGFPLSNGLLPVVAKSVIQTDAMGLGWLVGTISFGALIGSLVMGYHSNPKHAGFTMISGAILWHIGLLILSYITDFYLSLPMLFFIGFSQSLTMITMSMMLFHLVNKQMLGRVLGLRHLSVYGLPMGLLFSGFISENYNVGWALKFNALIGLIVLMLTLIKYHSFISNQGKSIE